MIKIKGIRRNTVVVTTATAVTADVGGNLVPATRQSESRAVTADANKTVNSTVPV